MAKILPPATGKAQWFKRLKYTSPDAIPEYIGILKITTKSVETYYEVFENFGHYQLKQVTPDGRWIDPETKKVLPLYLIDTIDTKERDVWECSCPDAARRPERKRGNCKHVRALRAVLKNLHQI